MRCLPRPPCLVAIVTSACLPAAFPSQRAIDGSGGESERARARAGAVSGRARPNRVKLVGRREGSGGEDDWPGEGARGVVEGWQLSSWLLTEEELGREPEVDAGNVRYSRSTETGRTVIAG